MQTKESPVATMLTDIPIDQVTIGERFRQDLGDIPALAAR
jgi:hypothetical protein